MWSSSERDWCEELTVNTTSVSDVWMCFFLIFMPTLILNPVFLLFLVGGCLYLTAVSNHAIFNCAQHVLLFFTAAPDECSARRMRTSALKLLWHWCDLSAACFENLGTSAKMEAVLVTASIMAAVYAVTVVLWRSRRGTCAADGWIPPSLSWSSLPAAA